jgi:uncharacterized membrane protein
LWVSPYYNKTTQRGLVKHYEALAASVDLPAILYNVPSRTGVDIMAKTACELAKIENIVAIKEATGDVSRAADIIAEIPLSHIVKEKVSQTKNLGAFEIVLLILGSPIWLSLLIAAAATVISVYISIWAIIISLWAVFASFVACSLSGLLLGVNFLLLGNLNVALFMLSAALVLAGLSIISFFCFKAVTKGFIILTKKFAIFIKSLFIKKEEKK